MSGSSPTRVLRTVRPTGHTSGPTRRVREQVRDQVLVMLFTLGASALLTLALTVLAR